MKKTPEMWKTLWKSCEAYVDKLRIAVENSFRKIGWRLVL